MNAGNCCYLPACQNHLAILTGVVFISNHVLEVKWMMTSLLSRLGYNSLIYNNMKLSSDYSRNFSVIFYALVFFSAYNVSYIILYFIYIIQCN